MGDRSPEPDPNNASPNRKEKGGGWLRKNVFPVHTPTGASPPRLSVFVAGVQYLNLGGFSRWTSEFVDEPVHPLRRRGELRTDLIERVFLIGPVVIHPPVHLIGAV